MNQGRDSFQPSSEPILAEIVEPPFGYEQPKRRNGCLALGLVLAGLLLVGGGVAIAIWIAQSVNQAKQDDLAAEESLRQDGKPQRIADAFVNERIEVSHKDHLAIEAVIQRVMKAGLNDDTRRVLHFIDADAFMKQMRRSGEIDSMPIQDRNWIRANMGTVTNGPVSYTNRKLASILPLNEREALVYLHAWDDDGYVDQQRWWMTKDDDTWKLSDWEDIDYGLSEATEYAILYDKQETVGVQEYYKAIDECERAIEHAAEGRIEQARTLITRAESRRVHAKFRGATQVALGLSWRELEDWERARQAFARVKNPSATPGSYYGQALHAYEMGEHEDVLEFAQKYIDLVGRSPSPRSWMAEAYEALGRDEDAIRAWTEVLKTLPDNKHALSRVVHLLPANASDQLVTLIQATSDPKETALRLVGEVYVRNELHVLRVARMIIGDDQRYRGTAEFLTAQEQSLKYQYPEAAASYLQATQATRDTERQVTFQYKYIDMMCTMERALEGYRKAELKQEAFDQITEYYDEGELTMEANQLLELVSLHEQTAPDEPWLDYYRGEALLEEEKFDLAEKAFRSGRAKADADAEDLISAYDYNIARVLADRDEELRAYEEAADRQSVFGKLADSLLTKGRIEDLRKLIAKRQNEAPEDFQIQYFRAQIDKADGEFALAIERLIVLQIPEDKSYYKYRTNTLMFECAANTDSWDVYFLAAVDQNEAFRHLSRIFQKDWRLEDLEQLISLHVQVGLDAGERFALRVNVAKSTGDDEALIKLAGEFTPGDWEKFEGYQARDFMDSLVDAYLRVRNLEKAADIAQRLQDEHDDQVAAILVAVHKGDVPRCKELLESLEKPYQLNTAYRHPLMTQFLSSERFAALRSEYPRPLELYDNPRCYLLLNSKPTITKDSLIESLAGVAKGKLDVETLPEGAPGWIVSADDVRLIISVARRLETFDKLGPHVHSMIDEHTHTLAVNVLLPRDTVSSAPLVAQVVGALTSPDTAAVYSPDSGRLVPNSPGWIAALDAQPRRWWYENGEVAYLHLQANGDDLQDQQPYWKRMRSMSAKQDEFAADPDTEHRVKVVANMGPVSIPIWLRVVKVENETVISEFLEPSPLLPFSHPGERVRISLPSIAEWTKHKSE